MIGAPPPAGVRPTTEEAWAEVARLPKPPQPRQFRSSGSPAPSMGTGLRVLGLVGVLLVVAIMGILGAKVISSLGDDSTTKAAQEVLTPTTTPGAPVPVPGSGAPPSGADLSPGEMIAGAEAAACAANRAMLESTVQVFEVTQGRPPASMEEMVAAGVLDETVPGFTVTSDGTTATITGTGDCAGG